METFIITFVAFTIFITLCAVGVIFSNKILKGSCGGLGKVLGGEKCVFCGETKCEEKEKDKALKQL